MKNFNLIFCLTILFLPISTKSQNIKKSYAFFQNINFGTIAADDNGRQLTPGAKTTAYLYLEIKKNIVPKISEVLYNMQTYKMPLVSLVGQQINVGAGVNDRVIKIVSAKENIFWKIEIAVKNDRSENIINLPKNKIIVNGKINKKHLAKRLIMKQS